MYTSHLKARDEHKYPIMDAPMVTSTQGAKKAAGDFAYHTFGRNPKTTGVVIIAMVVMLLLFIILFVVYLNKYKDCEHGSQGSFHGTSPVGNLHTGGNNPMWHKQMGDAGWGGTLHSSHQPGESRVWSSSADGGHTMGVTPVGVTSCGSDLRGSVSPSAQGEAQALMAVGAFDPSGSAKNMSDDALVRVMNGGA
jgi:hypothetical protein